MTRLVFSTIVLAVFFSAADAQWIQTNGPKGGFVQCLAANGIDIFAGTNGGVFRSTDNGNTWAASNQGLTNLDIQALIVTGPDLFAGTFGGGVFLSTNNGQNWIEKSSGLFGYVVSLAASPESTGHLFAGTLNGGGFYLSTDNGTNWNEMSTGLTNTVVSALAVSGHDVFAGTDGGVFLSTNYGSNWTAVDSGLTNTTILSLAVSPDSSGKLFAGTLGGGVFLTTNEGSTWSLASSGLTNGNVRALAISPTSPNQLAAGTYTGGVFVSSDTGASWSPANVGLTPNDVRAIAFRGANLRAGTYGGGIFSSTDNGGTWTPINNGLIGTLVWALTATMSETHGRTLFAGTSGGGVFLSTNDGTDWAEANSGLTNGDIRSLVVFPGSAETLFAGTYGGGVFRSTDNGTNWTLASAGLTSLKVRSLAVAPKSPSGKYLLAGTSTDGVFASTDDGGTWTSANTGILSNDIRALVVTPDSAEFVFAGTPGNGVFISANGGTVWTQAGLVSEFVTSLVASPNGIGGMYIFAGTSGDGVFMTTDNGSHWTAVNGGLPNTTINALESLPNGVGGTELFAGTNAGVFVTNNNGESWTSISTSLPYAVRSLTGDAQTLFAGTLYGGVWKRPLAQISSIHTFDANWNLVSVPRRVSDWRVHIQFPGSNSGAFEYDGSYIQKDSLEFGNGYWLRFRYADTIPIIGDSVTADSFSVKEGWNLLGSISAPVATSSITSNEPGTITSQFFKYQERYSVTDTIHPGRGYWVKSNKAAKLIFSTSPAVAGKNQITMVVNSELPPPSPENEADGKDAIPGSYSLMQNYPNPFNPTTTLRFALPVDSKVRLTIFGILGQTIATPVDGIEQAGYRSVEWDAGGVATGLYFYRFEATSITDPSKTFTQVRKMLLVK